VENEERQENKGNQEKEERPENKGNLENTNFST
jgi:hypothetical protein